jgi:small subunit ribosomal protein S17
MSEETNTAVDTRGRRKERVGQVISASMDKTITVSVEGVKYHALYKKAMKSTKKYKAHDEENTCNVGDLVRIEETRPLSKTKCWRLIEVVERAK